MIFSLQALINKALGLLMWLLAHVLKVGIRFQPFNTAAISLTCTNTKIDAAEMWLVFIKAAVKLKKMYRETFVNLRRR